MPPCGDDWEAGSAIVLTHFAQRNPGQSSYEPDRVTFCPWFIEDVKEMDEEGLLWDTTSSIYYLRRRATLIEDGNGNVDLDAWREWRNNYMPWGIPLPDIDMSIRFDTFLTGVVGHHCPSPRYVKYADYFCCTSSRTHLQVASRERLEASAGVSVRYSQLMICLPVTASPEIRTI